jgi:hypothetical protein
MNTDELFSRFRALAKDEVEPNFWSDGEVFDYMHLAYFEFVRLMGGVPDVTSPASRVPIVTGEAYGRIHPAVLRTLYARRASDDRPIRLINFTDLPSPFLDDRAGEVRQGVLGLQRGLIRWIDVPERDDEARIAVRRLPLAPLTGAGQCLHDLPDGECLKLLNGMLACAMEKPEAETVTPADAQALRERFETDAGRARAELERYEWKPRVVAYGGL